MAFEQMVEREVRIERDNVPKMTIHFEHLKEQAKDSDVTGGKETPQGSIEELQGGEHRTEHPEGKAIGDVSGRGKARETHELGTTHFESLADKVRDEKEGEAAKEREGGDGVHNLGKFEMKAKGKSLGEEARNMDGAELDRRTREGKQSVQQ